jgi:CheY-like chemotaxis protein
MSQEPTILVVDDNEDLLETFALILKRHGFSVETAASGAAAVAKFRQHNFDVTLMDIVMPEVNGIEAFRRIKEIAPDASVILMTAYSDADLLRAARDEGARCILNKPISIDRLIQLVNNNEVEEALNRAQEVSVTTCPYKPFDPTEALGLVEQSKKGNAARRADER